MSLSPPPVLQVHGEASRVDLQLQLPAPPLPPGSPFDGHFPEHAVLPGLIQLHWAVELARQYLQVEAALSELHGVKFQKVIQPGLQLGLELEWNAANAELRFRYHAGDVTYSAGKLRAAAVVAAGD
jgi:3-hydroxymyristoyl/3-hydroxydecanoyl-(acyl carrier protein) dehydratase